MRAIILLATFGVLAGCTVTAIDPARMTPAEFESRPDYMMIVPSVPKGAKVIGPVKASLCRKTKQDPVFSKEDVFRALKREAARKGGTALAEVNSTWVDSGARRCLEEGTASGVAFVREAKPH
jgi:hypothetical protein